jgi:hypothetical protein
MPNSYSTYREEIRTCPICQETRTAVRTLACGHHYCKPCLMRLICTKLGEGFWGFPLRCCGQEPMSSDDVQWLGDDEFYQKVRQRRSRWYISRGEWIQCPYCKGTHKTADVDMNFDCGWLCWKCDRRVPQCPNGCSNDIHPYVASCEDNELAKLICKGATEGWQVCPNCKNLAVKVGGCAEFW